MTVSFVEGDVALLVVVIDLHEPTSADGIKGVILLLGDIHTVGTNADLFGQKIDTLVLTVHHQFHRHQTRCPSQTDRFAELEADIVLQITEVIVRARQETPVFVFGHTEHFLFGVELDAVGFLVKAVPRPVASSFELSGHRCFAAAQGVVACVERVDIERAGDILLFAGDGYAVGRIEIDDRQIAAGCDRTGLSALRTLPDGKVHPCALCPVIAVYGNEDLSCTHLCIGGSGAVDVERMAHILLEIAEPLVVRTGLDLSAHERKAIDIHHRLGNRDRPFLSVKTHIQHMGLRDIVSAVHHLDGGISGLSIVEIERSLRNRHRLHPYDAAPKSTYV